MTAIISDIHGNLAALKSVLNKIQSMGIKDIYCLGDVVGYYPQINECCELLQEYNIPCLVGNHDWYMIAESFCPRSKSVTDCLEYQRIIIKKENFDWLKNNHLYFKNNDLFMVHGGFTNPIDEYLEPSKEYFDRIDGRFFCSGHTHVQIVCDYGDKIYCNPGSVGQPRDGQSTSAFAVFNDEKFHLHRVEYDIDATIAATEKAGFDGYYWGGLKTGAKSLGW